MAYGFQCINDSGTYQIDGAYPQLSLVRKISATTSISIQGSSGTTYSQGSFTLNSGEIAAVYCTSPVALKSTVNGVCTFISTGATGTAMDVYVFDKVTSSGQAFGFQVFDANGLIVFDAAQKPLVMTGFPSGQGDFTYNTSKKYAAICSNQYLQITDTQWSTGGAGGTNHRVQVTRGFMKGISGGINISNILYYDNTDVLDPGVGALDETVPATSNNHIIVDVTNY